MTTAHPFNREEVMAYLDGELSAAAAESARAHLEACPDCRAMAAGFARVSGQFDEWHVEPAPARLADRVSPPAPARGSLPAFAFADLLRWPRVAWMGAGAAVLAVGLFVNSGMQRAAVDDPEQGLYRPSDESLISRAIAPTPAPLAAPVDERSRVDTGGAAQAAGLPAQPMVIRIVALHLSTEKFDDVRPAVERLTAAHGGRIGSLTIGGDQKRRSLIATLRAPSAQLDALVAALRPLGQVQHESIGTEEVTSEYQDLSIRIATAKREEQRLIALLTNRTGKLSDVLDVEREIARVRTEIERMDAVLRARKDQVDFSTINLQVTETYRAELAVAPVSVGARLRNAFIDGVQSASDGVVGVMLAIVELFPALLLWALVLAWPIRLVVRRTQAWRRAAN